MGRERTHNRTRDPRPDSVSVSCFVYDVQINFCLFHGTS